MWTTASHYIDLSLSYFGKPDWVFATESPIPSPYPEDRNAVMLLGYPTFLVHLIPLLSWDEGFYTCDQEFIFEKEKFYIPNVSFYQNKDVQHFKVINKVLQSVDPEIQLFRDNNDFMPMLERIVSDLDNKTTDEFSDPIDSVWSVKILELASHSINELCNYSYSIL